MLADILPYLRCPLCRLGLVELDTTVRCPQEHSFDRAKQGYVHLTPNRVAHTGDSAPTNWILRLGSGDVHAILSLYALDPNARDTATAAIVQLTRDAGVTLLGTHDSDDVLGDSRVHFGYHDGISQPWEIVPISQSSVTAISLDYHWTRPT